MAFGYYMNMERMTLDIAREHLNYMTNDNMLYDVFLDEIKLINNVKNGFIIITQLNVFVESFVNTILNKCIGYNKEQLLKTSVDEKLEIIFLYYKKDFSIIKSQHMWEKYKKILKVRNEMIHYKKTYIGDGTGIPNFSITNIEVKEFFTKRYMEQAISEIILLGDKIAKNLDLNVFHNIDIFECDGRDGLVNYVYDKNITDIDETRFEQ